MNIYYPRFYCRAHLLYIQTVPAVPSKSPQTRATLPIVNPFF